MKAGGSGADAPPPSTPGGGATPPSDAWDPPAEPPPFPPFPRLASRRLYDSQWCALRRDIVRLPDGATQEYHVFEVPDAVCVVPVRADGRVVLIGQYRYPHGGTHWEVPAGRITTGESPEAAARRELLEETGHRPARLEPLPGFFPLNGISDHYVHLFLASGCEEVAAPTPDPAEQLVVTCFTPRELAYLFDSGRLRDGFTALAVAHYLRRSS